MRKPPSHAWLETAVFRKIHNRGKQVLLLVTPRLSVAWTVRAVAFLTCGGLGLCCSLGKAGLPL